MLNTVKLLGIAFPANFTNPLPMAHIARYSPENNLTDISKISVASLDCITAPAAPAQLIAQFTTQLIVLVSA